MPSQDEFRAFEIIFNRLHRGVHGREFRGVLGSLDGGRCTIGMKRERRTQQTTPNLGKVDVESNREIKN